MALKIIDKCEKPFEKKKKNNLQGEWMTEERNAKEKKKTANC